MLKHEGVKRNNRCPCLLPEFTGSWFLKWDEDWLGGVRGGRGEADLWVRLERWPMCSCHPLGVLCAGVTRSTLLLFPATQKWQLSFGLFVFY